jgi:hypothetical protein
MNVTDLPTNYRPPPYDGKRKGVVGVVMALTAISRQLDYMIRMQERAR